MMGTDAPAVRSLVSASRDYRVDRMSPARATPGVDNRIHAGDMIVADLRASRLPLEPRQFEFWFAYKGGRSAALNAAADEIKSKQGALTARDIERLHEAHLSPWRMAEQPDSELARID